MKFLLRFMFLPILSCCSYTTSAQLTVAGGSTPQQLVQNLLGNGVTVSNVTYTGDSLASGTFNGTASNIGLSSGVLLTTGHIDNAPGPNNVPDAGTDNMLPGYALLDSVAGVPTYDATILEFDFVAVADKIRFRFVFASEEYNEFVCGTVNDAFGFFLSGPGITGQQNIALIPGTTTPVSINTLNNGTCGIGYSFFAGCDTSHANFFVDNTSGTSIQYDGFTTVFPVQYSVTPGLTYHIRLVIADGGDYVYDSGVFLEEGSFASGISDVTNNELFFEMHPNPANDLVVLSTEPGNKKTTLTVFNTIGVKIHSEILTTGTCTLNTGDWSNGVYFVQMKSENKVSTRKLIIRH